MFTDTTNRPCQSLSDPFDYRHNAVIIPIGYELFNLRSVIESHGNNFEEFLDDLTTTLRSKVTSSQEYFLFKMEVLSGNYLLNIPNEVIAYQLGQLLDVLYERIKRTIVQEQLYIGDRFDYSVLKYTNHGLLFTKTQ